MNFYASRLDLLCDFSAKFTKKLVSASSRATSCLNNPTTTSKVTTTNKDIRLTVHVQLLLLLLLFRCAERDWQLPPFDVGGGARTATTDQVRLRRSQRTRVESTEAHANSLPQRDEAARAAHAQPRSQAGQRSQWWSERRNWSEFESAQNQPRLLRTGKKSYNAALCSLLVTDSLLQFKHKVTCIKKSSCEVFVELIRLIGVLWFVFYCVPCTRVLSVAYCDRLTVATTRRNIRKLFTKCRGSLNRCNLRLRPRAPSQSTVGRLCQLQRYSLSAVPSSPGLLSLPFVENQLFLLHDCFFVILKSKLPILYGSYNFCMLDFSWLS